MFSEVNGMGIVTDIVGEEVYYTIFAANTIYHKQLKDIVWNNRNWRWETSGLGGRSRYTPGGDRCHS